MRAKTDSASRYVLAEELGAGGMGIVRAAVDQRLGREVAIKTLRRTRRPERPLERRFLREACVQALLDHPAIVPVYDIGRDSHGSLYFSMKRIDGSTLDAIIERLRSAESPAVAKLAQQKLLRAFARVCRAVDFAHRRGVVHRDLKPGNVMLSDDGEAYVLDWGVSAMIGEEDPVSMRIANELPNDAACDAKTPIGETIGTPGYLSPEQACGAEFDARADIYALGAVLFELLSLEPLHVRGATTGILVSTLQGPDARPSMRAPQREIAPELDAICVRATALEPVDRYQTLAELIVDLESFIENPPARKPEPEPEPAPITEPEPMPVTVRRPRYAGWLAQVSVLFLSIVEVFSND
jgi:serine/threonine-protein kinase